MSVRLAFVDTETTGLDPSLHEIWEVGLVIRDRAEESEYLWHLPVDLGKADPSALKIGGFHDHYEKDQRLSTSEFAHQFASLTNGAHLVGAVISFDEERLRRLLRANGECPMWHYHLVDVEALAAGALKMHPPWDSEEISRAVGVDPAEFIRHSALGDARWAKAVYDAAMAFGVPR